MFNVATSNKNFYTSSELKKSFLKRMFTVAISNEISVSIKTFNLMVSAKEFCKWEKIFENFSIIARIIKRTNFINPCLQQ